MANHTGQSRGAFCLTRYIHKCPATKFHLQGIIYTRAYKNDDVVYCTLRLVPLKCLNLEVLVFFWDMRNAKKWFTEVSL